VLTTCELLRFIISSSKSRAYSHRNMVTRLNRALLARIPHYFNRLMNTSSAVNVANEVICERLGPGNGVARLTLNREKALNALSKEMCISINEALSHWLPDPNLRCLIVRGAGKKAFCAGGDVKSIALEAGPFTPGMPGSLRSDFFREEYMHDFALAQARALGADADKTFSWMQVRALRSIHWFHSMTDA
jgi:Enoyl-CoA hydratase/isomerase